MSDMTPSDPNEQRPPPGAAPTPPNYPPPGPYGGPPGAAPPFGQAPPGASYGFAPVPVDSQGRPLAEWWQRLLAILIDSVMFSVVYYILLLIVIGSSFHSDSFSHFGIKLWIVDLVVGLGAITYFAILGGGPKGQTVGQMALGIAVRDVNTGGAITPQRAAVRMVILYPWMVFIWIPFAGGILTLLGDVWGLICGLSPLWNDNRQGYHDISQKTTVIKVR
jgi:uncharacterized RDD family membrane protein YckC